MDDPFERPFWTLVQTVAWIAFRDPGLVRKADSNADPGTFLAEMDGPSAEKILWEEHGLPMDFLKLDIEIAHARASGLAPRFNGVSEAADELRAKLRVGEVRLLARLAASEERRHVPLDECQTIRFRETGSKERRRYTAGAGARIWQDIIFTRSEVLRVWPDPAAQVDEVAASAPPGPPMVESADIDPVRTGAPGRPTSMHLIKSEFRRRAERSAQASTLAQEAQYLREWLGKEYPAAPHLTEKAIKNGLRELYKAAQAARK